MSLEIEKFISNRAWLKWGLILAELNVFSSIIYWVFIFPIAPLDYALQGSNDISSYYPFLTILLEKFCNINLFEEPLLIVEPRVLVVYWFILFFHYFIGGVIIYYLFTYYIFETKLKSKLKKLKYFKKK